jgi:hypothetical protein
MRSALSVHQLPMTRVPVYDGDLYIGWDSDGSEKKHTSSKMQVVTGTRIADR